MSAPRLVDVENLRTQVVKGVAPVRDTGDGTWVLARAEGYDSIFHRVRLAWMVFTGRPAGLDGVHRSCGCTGVA